MARGAVFALVAILVWGCGSTEPRDVGRMFGEPTPRKESSSGRNGAGGSGDIPAEHERYNARLADSPVIAAVAADRWEQTEGENGYSFGPEVYLGPRSISEAIGLPGHLRLNGRIRQTHVDGRFGDGSDVRFKQNHTKYGIGPNWVWASPESAWGFEFNALWQYKVEERMEHDDNVPGDRRNSNIPELRLQAWTGELLPVLHTSADDMKGMSEFEGIVELDTDKADDRKDKLYLRGTVMQDVLNLGSVSAGTLGDSVAGRSVSGQWPFVSIRVGPRVEGYGGGTDQHWHWTYSGGVRAYFPGLPISADAFFGRGPGGNQSTFGIWAGWTF